MFESVENNRKMILGAYRKLKSYYYYDKTILYNKISLAMWESDSHSFENRVNRLAKFMCTLENEIDYNYLTPLMRSIVLVIDESKHRTYIEEQLIQILKFYNARQAIEYRSAWINVFSLILINERYDCFVKFLTQLMESIDRITTNQIELIEHFKTTIVLNEVKESLLEQVRIAASIAIAPLAIDDTKDNVVAAKNSLGIIIENDILQDIFDNAKDIRNANMFNNHLSTFPLIS